MSLSPSEHTLDVMRLIGARIRLARWRAGMNTTDLARALGINRHTVEAIEAGSARTAIGTVLEVARQLEVRVLETTSDPGRQADDLGASRAGQRRPYAPRRSSGSDAET